MFHHSSAVARRRGSIIPMMAVCATALFGFVALAIDVGMMVVARSAAQNAADTAALTGARTLDNRVPVGMTSDTYDNQKAQAITNATQSVVTYQNPENHSTFSVSSVVVGIYDYNTSTQVFTPQYPGGTTVGKSWDVTNKNQSKPSGKAWSTVEVAVASNQPSYFSRIFGVTSLPQAAYAVAAHRPRDIAIILDMSGSMKFGSTFSYPPGTASSTGVTLGLMNPDPSYPRFGHYFRYPTSSAPNAFMRTTQFIAGTGEVFAPTNMTMDADVGPAMIRQFVFDPSGTAGSGITNAAGLLNAFHKWNPPGMAPLTTNGPFGTMSPATGYNGYNAFDTSNTSGPTPAPDTFATQEDNGTVKYVGDRYPRKAGLVKTDATSWDSTTTTGSARTVWELLFPTSVTTVPTLSASTLRPAITTRAITGLGVTDARIRQAGSNTPGLRESGDTWTSFTDGAWEMGGYDLDVAAYDAQAGAATPATTRLLASAKALQSTPTFPTNGRFQGYSMGPAYYGKTFFMWPPDPRWGNPNDPTTPLGGGIVRPDLVLATVTPGSADTSKMVKDSNGNWICDWRRRFFLTGNSADTGAATTYTYFDPEGDNDPNTTGTQSINQALLRTGVGHTLRDSGTTTRAYRINYRAVLAWIKSGPQVLPPNLRAGHIRYYTSIPDNVDNAGSPGSTEAYLDQRFWREYIDYVMGYAGNNTSYNPTYGLAGVESSQWTSNVSIGATAAETYTVGTTNYTNRKPYMNYTDVASMPRMHFWFGPASMLSFLTARTSSSDARNFNSGSLAEAQDWQLKAGVRSALDDIKNNHPNDRVGSTYFAGTNFTTIRAPMGQDWDTLKNALYYPQTLLAGIKSGAAPNAELRPYNSSFGEALVGNIPNANDGTDPVTGFALAYNLCSSATTIPSIGQGTGRRGATKIVIFETDGVPNQYRTFNFTGGGVNSYYTPTSTTGGNGNGDPTSISMALDVIDQTVASTTANGFSLSNSPARVYPIAFGDLFSSTSTYKASALSFLQDVAYHGQTGASASTALPSYQIITGTAQQRVDGLRTTFERILQSGVQVTLIE
ncbi:pilus assembly protein TadG-related protein [Limnoglobus roseus]|uniref:Putative Flp pilus-assembly TadG-like N-terminal domain-containing protein n=1 Tax=Limnoglobus roseus TaxID=2598579 RepID=A0A5C1A5M7_9BACT|nr:pilus assembly protein TadG-related protein [Limnoglobus roseus]QEL13990.1 hypothetical protein PX52LOC_00851 [Limnoglobus roseus]